MFMLYVYTQYKSCTRHSLTGISDYIYIIYTSQLPNNGFWGSKYLKFHQLFLYVEFIWYALSKNLPTSRGCDQRREEIVYYADKQHKKVKILLFFKFISQCRLKVIHFLVSNWKIINKFSVSKPLTTTFKSCHMFENFFLKFEFIATKRLECNSRLKGTVHLLY